MANGELRRVAGGARGDTPAGTDALLRGPLALRSGMEVMMPEMDGYETIREIRKRGAFRDLPIIAVTAKAMKGDREKTLEAGAWDYLAKPADSEQLFSVLRGWLHR
jgi:CheY-like chemotaxis protein